MEKRKSIGILSLGLMIAFVIYNSPSAMAKDKTIQVNIDNQNVETDVNPIINNGTTLIPVNTISNNFPHLELMWDNQSKTLRVINNNETIHLEVGEKVATSSQNIYQLNEPAQIIQSRVMAPIRFIAEITGSTVKWNSSDRTVYIQSSEPPVSVAPENNKVKLYPAKVDEYGAWNGMVLEINGEKKQFENWKGGDSTHKPVVRYIDLTNDGTQEVIVSYTKGTGTGVHLGQVHVINPNNLEEFKVESLDETVEKHVQSTVEKYGDRVEAKVAIDNEPVSVKVIPDNAENKDFYNDEVTFGSSIYYSIEKGKLTAKITGNISPAAVVGELKITYGFRGGQLKAEKVEYTEF